MEQNSWRIDANLTTADSAEVSEFTRLFGFYRPNAAMRDIVRNPTWIVPLALSSLAAMAYIAVVSRQPAPVLAAAGVAANVCIRTLLSAGLLTLFLAAVTREPAPFRQVFAVVSYARMPGVVFTVLSIILILMRRASGLPDGHPVNPMLTSLAVFLDPASTSRFVYTLASSVDCFVFWQFSLIALGLKMASRISSTAANFAVVSLWVVMSFAQAAWAQFAFR